MSEYHRRFSAGVQLPQSRKLQSKYHALLSRSPHEVLGVALASPVTESDISSELAARFNHNRDKYDSVIDHVFNETKVGGSALHHNLDGSHTFDGALQALRTAFPKEPEFVLRLQSLEHLARDFTTPSAINPFLSATSFGAAKACLVQHVGLSASLANDLLNLNAGEAAGAIFGPGLLLLEGGLQANPLTTAAARQLGRLTATYFFAGNVLGLLFASALFVRSVIAEHREGILASHAAGVGELVLAAVLFPFIPLSLTLIVATAASAWCHRASDDGFASELNALLRKQFPGYRSYLSRV